MMEKTTQSVGNLGYHAHIYYDPTRTRAVAERVCAEIGEKFRVDIRFLAVSSAAFDLWVSLYKNAAYRGSLQGAQPDD